ncbi:YSIRK-type signal peptide-containing protein [Streptococcus pseudoporcinus]|uniref:Putative immunoglobulin G-binding protein G n=1 Tax=Streptococcus pseudoporcinus TaxID=361101 RepID=A0A4U9YGM2_9STRE|nr:YSIRK-type signal peptide-containing protein [Streptococcus pseudoporcinus]VTS25472.1 putative immunoglobulin G-binding protein G [Streptococcus pseudoporcinus]VUC71394.1 putative immunoglobulin G-binding protein G [Streptococcus pseudoporcinus]VUD00811.1 putative immunoglobulin G-binding protein G [Streptococcus pseudoporcinus]VUD01143.1 putative immunoglobulin G-binding protein G [Streptococcus pseudoporcinus]
MKENKCMKYYLRKSAYGLAAVSVAVLAGGSVVSANEVSSEPEAVMVEAKEKTDEEKTDKVEEPASTEVSDKNNKEEKKEDKEKKKADKEEALKAAKEKALAELDALDASRLIKKIVETAKTIEGLNDFLEQTLPGLKEAHKAKLEEELKREVAEEHPEILENEGEENVESETPQTEKPESSETEVETTDSVIENPAETTSDSQTEEMVESLTKETPETVDHEKAKQDEVAKEIAGPQESNRIAETASSQAMPRAAKVSHYSATLPVTGEDHSSVLTAIAMSVIATSGMVAYGTKREKQ